MDTITPCRGRPKIDARFASEMCYGRHSPQCNSIGSESVDGSLTTQQIIDGWPRANPAPTLRAEMEVNFSCFARMDLHAIRKMKPSFASRTRKTQDFCTRFMGPPERKQN